LPRTTAGYFIRLETGQIHTQQDILKLTMKFWSYILQLPQDSLVRECYEALKLVGNNEHKLNWTVQIRQILKKHNVEALWDTQNSDDVELYMTEILSKNEILLKNLDVERMQKSDRHPNYALTKKHVWREKYLQDCPHFARGSIAQIRLGENVVLTNSNIYKLTDSCKYCGQNENIDHILLKCKGYGKIRESIIPESEQLQEITDFISDKECEKSPKNYVICHKLLNKTFEQRGL